MKSILTTLSFVSIALLIGRVSGFIRDLILAGRYGATEQADVIIVLLSLPDFTVGLLLAGGFSAVLTPRLCKVDGVDRLVLAQTVALFSCLAFGILAGGIALWPQTILSLLAPSASIEALSSYQLAMVITLAALPLAAVTGALTSYLNSNDVFIVPNLGTLVFNLTLCLFLLFWWVEDTLLIHFAIALVMAGVMRLVLLLWKSWHLIEDYMQLRWARLDLDFAMDFVAGVLSLSLVVAMPIVFRTFYAAGGVGNLAIFNYSFKLFELPSALIFGPLVTILLPKLSKIPADDYDRFYSQVVIAIKAILMLACVITGIWLCVGDGLARLIFLRGAMKSDDVQNIAETTLYLYLALPFAGLTYMSTIALNALGLPKRVLRNSLISGGLAVALQLLLSPSGEGLEALLPFLIFYGAHAVLNCLDLTRRHGRFMASVAFQVVKIAGTTLLACLPLWWAIETYMPNLSALVSLIFAAIIGSILLGVNFSTIRSLLLMRRAAQQ